MAVKANDFTLPLKYSFTLNIYIIPIVVFDMTAILTLAEKNTIFCFQKVGLYLPNFQIHIKNGVKIWGNWHFFENFKREIGVFGIVRRFLGGCDTTLSMMRLSSKITVSHFKAGL